MAPVGVAVCVARPGVDPAAIGLEGWLDGRLARYKLPKHVVWWEAMPKSAYGKIVKKDIRERLVQSGALAQSDAGAGAKR